MKSLVLIIASLLLLTVNAQESEKHRIYHTCINFDDLEQHAEYKECVACLNKAYNGEVNTTDADVKPCISKMPSQFSSCESNPETKKCLIAEMAKYRETSKKLFIAKNKDYLSFKERIQLGQVWSAFLLYVSMLKELPKKMTIGVLKPALPCFTPGFDLTPYDERETEELQEDEEDKERVVRDVDVARSTIKSMNRRTYRLYVCSMQKISEDKEAKSIIKDFVRTYHGGVPAKVAQGYCNW